MSNTGPTPSDKAAWASVHEWKNEVKHMSKRSSARTVKIDPAYAAMHHIEEALRNFYKLRMSKSDAIWRFEDAPKHLDIG